MVEYTCYDITTFSSSRDGFSNRTDTTTRCHFRVLPSEGGGGIEFGDGGSGGGVNLEPPPPCWTINNLLESSQIKKAFEGSLKYSKIGTKKAHEEGGLIFERIQSGNIMIVNLSPGTINRLPRFWNDYNNAMNGASSGYRLLAWYHTHPGGNSNPSGKTSALTI